MPYQPHPLAGPPDDDPADDDLDLDAFDDDAEDDDAKDDEDPDDDDGEEDGDDDADDPLDDELDDDLDGDLDEEFPLGDGTVDTSAEVWCPHCGEESEISLDPGGGSVQQYVEDCPVCCRPWMVTVRYDAEGGAIVSADADDDLDDDA